MTTRSWLRNLFASRTIGTIREAPARRQLPECWRVRPCLERLEDRLTPSTTTHVGPTTADLIAVINKADATPGPVVLILPTSTVYVLTQPDNPTTNGLAGPEDQNWYGPNGLPAIDNDITIQGNGSTIQRSTASGTPNLRLFYVSGGLEGELPLGRLTLNNLTLQGGLARGGDGGNGGGGGMGAGGAIFNQGTLILNGVTLVGNEALGGDGSTGFGGGGGGGMGSDGSAYGGGFGGNFPALFGGAGGVNGGGGGGFITGANGANGTSPPGGAGGGLGGFGGAGGFISPFSPATGGDGGGGGVSSGGELGFGGGAFGSGGISGGGTGNSGRGGGGGGVGGGGGAGASLNDTGGGGGFGGGGAAYGANGGFGGGGGQNGGNGGFGGGNAGGFFSAGGGGAGMGGAIFNMGASTVPNSGVVLITNSTLTANTAQGGSSYLSANGGSGYGGALFNLDGSVTLNNSTLAANIVQGGEGGSSGDDGQADGGAVYNLAFGNLIQTGAATSVNLVLYNSILSNTTGGTDLVSNAINGNNTNTAAITGSTNLVQTTNISNTNFVAGIITIQGDPHLDPLGDYGGPTQTMMIFGGPAYGVGNTSVPGLPSTDQRGPGFSRVVNRRLDLGAFEIQDGDAIGVLDPGTGTWYLKSTKQPGAPDVPPFRYGAPTWTPLTGDWDGNGSRTVGVFDPIGQFGQPPATWYLRNSNSPGAPDFPPFAYGTPGWIPIVGDWNGNGTTTIGVVEPATMTWYLKNSNGPGAWDVSFRYGQAGDVPVVGDWDGNGTTIGVWRPATATWFLRNSNTPGAPDITPFAYGQQGDVPVTGDWNADRVTTVGVFRPGTASWYLRNSNTPGTPDIVPFAYGGTNWLPVTGTYATASLLEAAGGPQTGGAQAAPLSQADLDGVVAAALTRLEAAGVDGALLGRLSAAQFQVSHLPPGELGVAFPSADKVLIDTSAAGHGWFVDPTPLQDEEFTPAPSGALSAAAGAPAGDRMDLLTAVLHELGHLAGLPDVSTARAPADLMGDQLGGGNRLTAALDQVFARSPF